MARPVFDQDRDGRAAPMSGSYRDAPGPSVARAEQEQGFGYDYEYEALRPQWSTARKATVVVVAVLAVLVLLAGVASIWLLRQLDPPGDPGAEVRLTIPTGSSTSAIADLLADEGVIASASVFRQYVRYKGDGPFLAGEFVLREDSAMWDVVDVLDAGPAAPPFEEFTLPEGLTNAEITARIAEGVPAFSLDRLVELVGSGQLRSSYQPAEVSDLEGFLFPDTYRVQEGEDELAVLSKLVEQFDLVADDLGLDRAAAAVGLSPYEVVIVASLIQEESRLAADSPRIARVIYNRLESGERLGIDATLCYLEVERPCRLTQSDLAAESPYNSRLNSGLPPTPIAAPGRAAIEAALNPAEGNWTFYVLDPNADTPGGHFFTDDPDEFARVKAQCEAADLGCG